MNETKHIHDLNNALTGIIGIASLLKESVNEMEFEEKEYFEKNIELLMMATNKATNIVNELRKEYRK